jgi:hypothetical protein
MQEEHRLQEDCEEGDTGDDKEEKSPLPEYSRLRTVVVREVEVDGHGEVGARMLTKCVDSTLCTTADTSHNDIEGITLDPQRMISDVKFLLGLVDKGLG